MGQRVPNQEPESPKLIPYREPRSLKILKTGTYQEPGTEPGSSGLNFLGQPRSNWLYREVTVFLQEYTVFYVKLLAFTEKFGQAQFELQFKLKFSKALIYFFDETKRNVTNTQSHILRQHAA